MYAIVNIQGKQFRVAESQRLYVPLLHAEKGERVEFPDVRLFSGDAGIEIGTPTLANAMVVATVLEHMKDEKVIVFKKKRRKGYRRLRGHRQQYTQVEIQSILRAGEEGFAIESKAVEEEIETALTPSEDILETESMIASVDENVESTAGITAEEEN